MKRTVKRATKWLAIALALAAGDRHRRAILQRQPLCATYSGCARKRAGPQSRDGGDAFQPLRRARAFRVDNVVIHENPAIGIEPIAYVGSLEAVPRLASLFGGHLEFASMRLDDARSTSAKTGGPSEPGRWNFEPLLSRSVIRAIPELHVRSGRINFKFGDTKSVFYLTSTDLDIAPPSLGAAAWNVDLPANRPVPTSPRTGSANSSPAGAGRRPARGRLDLDVRLEKSEISEIVALLHGSTPVFTGPFRPACIWPGRSTISGFRADMNMKDVHRWDRMPPYGQSWPVRLAGRLNVPAQT